VDVVIIGAGAAGIAAGRRLRDRGRAVLVLEALGRVGGRGHTVTAGGIPLDLGCGWLHSAERNPLVRLAEAEGFVIDRTPAAWRDQLRQIGFSVADQRATQAAFAELERNLRDHPPAEDVAGRAIARDHPWRAYLDMVSGALNGAELDRVSARDFLAYEDAATDSDWRLPAGYGALLASAAARVPVRLETWVEAVDARGSRVRIDSSAGPIEAKAAIVAVPTDVLARGAIRFQPAADDHLHAAASLPLGRVDKLFLQMAQPDAVPPDSHLLGDPHSALTGSYYLRPFGRPVIECFFGGVAARAMAELGDDGRTAFAIGQLEQLLGTDFARGLTPIAGSWWHRELSIGGAYSHALPGRSDQRAVLALPLGDRLFFAGEACSAHDYSTVHGAWQSGLDAADAAEALLAQAG
jgi:monoamine oxidase